MNPHATGSRPRTARIFRALFALSLALVLGLAWGFPADGRAQGRQTALMASELFVTLAATNFNILEGTTVDIIVLLNRPLGPGDPAEVTVDYAVETVYAEPGRDYVPTPPRTLTFTNGGPQYLLIPLETLDDGKHEGTERLILRLSNPVGMVTKFVTQAVANILDDDPFDPLLLDDFEGHPYLWTAGDTAGIGRLEILAGDPAAVPGQGAYEGVLEVTVPLQADVEVMGRTCGRSRGVIPVVLRSTGSFDATQIDHATVTLGGASEVHVMRRSGEPRRHQEDVDGDGDLDLVFHFRAAEAGLTCDLREIPFSGRTYDGRPVTAGGGTGAGFGRSFALGRDWTGHEGLSLWFHGQGSGGEMTVRLLDNRAPDPGPGGWELVWADEFDAPAGAPPDPARWSHEIGDGAVNGVPGWGNAELQYYTTGTDNVAHDGQGNLVITADEGDGTLQCFYGPCRYTSARLVSHGRAEFAYGRIEARMQMPDGDAGLWPAFWGLGTDIGQVGWPRSGEIDFMEYVSRQPHLVYGTIHGPGYSGAGAFGNIHDTYPERVADDFHVFAVQWQPDLIEWFVDGILYHSATPDDVSWGDWVFNHPMFLIFNVAVGGYFGGPVSPSTTFPQSMAMDYIRVYQGPDTAERWEVTIPDDFSGWREVEVPFSAFTRSADQPAGAPDDGLGLSEVWGYGFRLSGPGSGRILIDQVRLVAPLDSVPSPEDPGYDQEAGISPIAAW